MLCLFFCTRARAFIAVVVGYEGWIWVATSNGWKTVNISIIIKQRANREKRKCRRWKTKEKTMFTRWNRQLKLWRKQRGSGNEAHNGKKNKSQEEMKEKNKRVQFGCVCASFFLVSCIRLKTAKREQRDKRKSSEKLKI